MYKFDICVTSAPLQEYQEMINSIFLLTSIKGHNWVSLFGICNTWSDLLFYRTRARSLATLVIHSLTPA